MKQGGNQGPGGVCPEVQAELVEDQRGGEMTGAGEDDTNQRDQVGAVVRRGGDESEVG